MHADLRSVTPVFILQSNENWLFNLRFVFFYTYIYIFLPFLSLFTFTEVTLQLLNGKQEHSGFWKRDVAPQTVKCQLPTF